MRFIHQIVKNKDKKQFRQTKQKGRERKKKTMIKKV